MLPRFGMKRALGTAGLLGLFACVGVDGAFEEGRAAIAATGPRYEEMELLEASDPTITRVRGASLDGATWFEAGTDAGEWLEITDEITQRGVSRGTVLDFGPEIVTVIWRSGRSDFGNTVVTKIATG